MPVSFHGNGLVRVRESAHGRIGFPDAEGSKAEETMEKEMMTSEADRKLVNFDPLRDWGGFPTLSGLFDELFAPLRLPAAALPKNWMPRVDIQETDKEYILSVALPGVRKEDVKLDVRDGMLSITGERRSEKEEKGKTWLRKESSYGSFRRSFMLPDGTHPEDVKAAHKDGVLTISMPKPVEVKAKGVRINVE